MNISLELQQKILSYVDPDPVVYTRLAMVSKSWYSLFTSDEKWLALDFKGLKTDLFKSYLEPYSNAEKQTFLKLCWSGWQKCDKEFTNKYGRNYQLPIDYDQLSTLGLVRHYSHDLRGTCMSRNITAPIPVSEQYARVAIGLNRHTLQLFTLNTLKNCADVVERCVRIDPQCLNWLHGDILVNYKERILTLLKGGENNLAPACEELITKHPDGDFLWEAVEYQPDLEKMIERISKYPILRIKVAFYQVLLQNHSRDELEEMFSRTEPELYSDIELWRKGIVGAPDLLEFASKNVKDDEEVVTRAVEMKPIMLWEASPRLRKDPSFCAALVNMESLCFYHVPDSVKQKKEFTSKLTFEDFEDMWEEVPPSYWNDETIVRKAMQDSVKYFRRASARVRRNRELALVAVGKKESIYYSLDPKLKKDKEIALRAMKRNPRIYEDIPPELRGDKEIASLAPRVVEPRDEFSAFMDELSKYKDEFSGCSDLSDEESDSSVYTSSDQEKITKRVAETQEEQGSSVAKKQRLEEHLNPSRQL